MVYNNFPWPEPSDTQRALIEQAAQAVIDVRSKHSNITLANMYKEKNFLLLGDLKTAHDNLNRAVMAAYGFPIKNFNESDCVTALIKMYQELTAKAGN